MSSQRSSLLAFAALLLAALVGWLLMHDAADSAEIHQAQKKRIKAQPDLSPPPASQLGTRDHSHQSITRDDLISLQNERLVTFQTEDAYQNALKNLKRSGFKNLGQLDRLRTLRIGYNRLSDLEDWLDDDAEISYNYYASIPTIPDVEAQPNAVGFGASALSFIGINSDNESWGKDVTVAVLDTGNTEHLTLGETLPQINIASIPEGAEQHGHGTPVTSIIAGQDDRLRGVAPDSTILPIRVADENGISNSFYIAEGILSALEQGAQVINISIGGEGNSILVQEAVELATSHGIAIVASAGNDGLPYAYYPAAYDGVISVGAVDARGIHLNFSNQSETLDFSAPGLAVNAAWPGDRVIEFSGTSASTPFVTGAISAIISQSDAPLTGIEAAEILQNYSNEAGAAGFDPYYGYGTLDVGRALDRDTPDIEDLAVASHYFVTTEEGNGISGLQINVENRGTTDIAQSTLEVSLDDGNYPFTVNSLDANERKDFFIPLTTSHFDAEGNLEVESFIESDVRSNDTNPQNNQRSDQLTSPNAD